MDTTGWTNPVMIVCKRSGQIVTITSTQEALDTLLNSWPTAEGAAFLNALQVCAAALEERASNRVAREAFMAAAHEARVPIETMTAV